MLSYKQSLYYGPYSMDIILFLNILEFLNCYNNTQDYKYSEFM